MGKKPFKSQASSSRLDPESGSGSFGSVFTGSTLSYMSEPPNLTSITDANVVVAFKSLTKKDSTTKSKALEDLNSYVRSHPYENAGGVEQPILEAWVKTYPRMSIDNSRRVRELSHSLQYGLLISARKRMEKHIPSTVGPWLAGTYDKDRAVSRVAVNGIDSFLDSDEKVVSFWRRCQPQILAYAQDAMEETPQTLSDERSVSVDDAQAKYDRVMGSSLSLVLNLLLKLDHADVENQRVAYARFFSSYKTPWEFIACQDSSLRRIAAQLILVCLDKESDIIQRSLETVSQAFLSEGLRVPQNGSALTFLNALNRATEMFPQIWLSKYKGKKSVLSRLRLFIGKGSQGGPPQFWQTLATLILRLPHGVLPTDLNGAVDFLKAYREGISSRDEVPRNGFTSRTSYLDVVSHFRSYLREPGAFEQLLRIAVYPAFGEFLQITPNDSNWSMGNSVEELANSFQICYESESSTFPQSLKEEWMRLAKSLITRLRIDFPEPHKSTNHNESQVTVAAEAARWFDLQAKIIDSITESESKISEDSVVSFLRDPSFEIVNTAIEVLTNRNNKLNGAGGILAAALRLAPKLLNCSPSISDIIVLFFKEEFLRLVVSPIPLDLIDAFQGLRNLPDQESQFKSIWKAGVNRLLAAPDDNWKMMAVNRLIANHSISQLARQEPGLQAYLLDRISSLVKGFDEDWRWLEDSIRFDLLDVETFNQTASIIVRYLRGHDGSVNSALRALELIVKKNPQLLQTENLTGVTIITQLLALTESSDHSIVSRAKLLRAQIELAREIAATKSPSTSLTIDILRDNLETAGPLTLAVDTLVDQARDFIQIENGGMNLQIFPNTTMWSEALAPFLEQSPDLSLELMTGVGPVLPLVRSVSQFPSLQLSRDSRGYSIPFRMAKYTSEIIAGKPLMDGISAIDKVEILRLLSLTKILASDQLGLREDNKLCLTCLDPHVERDLSNLLSAIQLSLISIFSDATSWYGGHTGGSSTVAQKLISDLIVASSGNSSLAFYSARALGEVIASLVGIHGWKVSGGDEWLSSLDILNTSTFNPFAGVAILSNLLEFLDKSKLVKSLCNRLLSDMTDALATDKKTFKLLLFLNATLSVYQSPSPNLPIAQNRVIFAVKHLIEWMRDDQDLPLSIVSETFRTLQFLMVSLGAVYGPHWEAVIKYCARFWNDKRTKQAHDRLAALYNSVRLIRMLQNLQDPNEDLSEALEEHGAWLSNGLVQLLMVNGRRNTQPWRIFDDILWRLSKKIPSHHIKDISILYPLLASEFTVPQISAYVILCQAIPAAQEQISIDVILEKKDAQLPEELLSLLLEIPSMENHSDDGFPPSAKTYLFSWKLVFSSYPKASEKVRNDYNQTLRAGNYISPFLDFLFDILGHSEGRPIKLNHANISAEDIQSYDAKRANNSNASHHLLWLSVHLYHQCLKFAPGLAKSWWMNCKSKQMRMVVESWTEKHISPLIITESLNDVMAWVSQQEAISEDDKEMIVKVSKNAREVYAGFEIDETQMQIVIRLPATYPLEGVKVDGVNRVAVSEKKWQSWLMITQGVITFSNSSIVEGLIAFRKNVTGALKDHTECAICYSIISSDKKMPDKRCQTCKNLFHASCLFKWFASSNQSSCPLCRNPFNYGAGWDVATRARRRGGPE